MRLASPAHSTGQRRIGPFSHNVHKQLAHRLMGIVSLLAGKSQTETAVLPKKSGNERFRHDRATIESVIAHESLFLARVEQPLTSRRTSKRDEFTSHLRRSPPKPQNTDERATLV